MSAQLVFNNHAGYQVLVRTTNANQTRAMNQDVTVRARSHHDDAILQLVAGGNGVGTLTVTVEAINEANGQARIWKYECGVKIWSNVLYLVGVPELKLDHYDPVAAGWATAIGTTGKNLTIDVTGALLANIQWVVTASFSMTYI
jgi:hypothetical protein